MKKLFAIVGLFSALVAESAPTATRAYVDAATNLVYELATSNKQDKIKYAMTLPYGPVKYKNIEMYVTDWEFNYESNRFEHATVNGNYLCETNDWTYWSDYTDVSGDTADVSYTFDKYSGNLVVHDTYYDTYITWYPNNFGLDVPKYDISTIVDFIPIAAHTNRLVTSAGVAQTIAEFEASVNSRVSDIDAAINQRIYAPDGLSYFTSSGEVYRASWTLANTAWMVTRSGVTKKYSYRGLGTKSQPFSHWWWSTDGKTLECESEYASQGRFFFRVFWDGVYGWFDTNEKYDNYEDCLAQIGFVAYEASPQVIEGDQFVTATRVYVSTNWTKVAQVVWKDEIPTVVVDPLMATNIVNGLLANYPTIEEARRIPTTKLSDSDELRWLDVYGNVYQVSWPTYWKITCGGLTYGLRTNSVDNGVITWRNGTTEYPQLVYDNGTWTAYNPSGVSMGALTDRDGTETNLVASSWSAVKGAFCETNIVDHLVYERNVADGLKAIVTNVVNGMNISGSVTTNDVKNIVTNDVLDATKVVGSSFNTPVVYEWSSDDVPYATTNLAVRWNGECWEAHVAGWTVLEGQLHCTNDWFKCAITNEAGDGRFLCVNSNLLSDATTVWLGDKTATGFSENIAEGLICYANGTQTYTITNGTRNALGLAYEKDIPSAISNNVPAWALSETPPESMTDNAVVLTNNALETKSGTAITATAVGAATSTELATVSANVNSALLYSSGIYQYMIGNTNAWFEGTNYNTNASTSSNKVHYAHESWEDVQYTPCSLQLYEIRDGQRNVVWDQRDWTVYYWQFKSAQLSNHLATATANLAADVNSNTMKRGWAKYTAVKGLDNPATNTLWVDTENISLMAGKNWEKLVTVGGTGYYTLTGNGVEISPESATNTFLTIKDFEGNAVLTFRKTSSYLVYCECGTDITDNYHDAQGRVVVRLTTDVCPTAEFSTVLDTSGFVAQGDADCPVDYEWTGSAGNWECHFLLKSSVNADACFARFKVLREGENVIEYSQPIRINGGISFEQNGTTYKIKPSVSGSTVTWSVVQ